MRKILHTVGSIILYYSVIGGENKRLRDFVAATLPHPTENDKGPLQWAIGAVRADV